MNQWKSAGLCLLILTALAFGANSSKAKAACPNEAFRFGPSAQLPDCRAYELVTPSSTDGRLVEPIIALHPFDLFATELISPSGESYVYMTFDAGLAEPQGSTGTFDVFEAVRASSGWATIRRLSPSGGEAVMPDAGGVSSEHRYAFTHVAPVSGEAGTRAEGSYLGNPDGTFEFVGVGLLGSEPYASGRYISPDGQHIIFTTGAVAGGVWCAQAGSKCLVKKLEESASPTGTPAIYDRSPDGPTKVVSLLPGDVTPAAGQAAEYQGVSSDGSAVAFKIGGSLYVRINDSVTLPVTSEPSTFAGLSSDGHRLFYVSAGNIFRYETSSHITDQVNASGDAQIVNVSADGSHVYFISESQLDGAKGTAGQPNMYVWSGGSPVFIAMVLPSDLARTSGSHVGYPALANWTKVVTSPDNQLGNEGDGPGANSSRSTADGTYLAFESRARLTGYDNAGHTEIYRYSDADKAISCASCSPSDLPATEDARFQELTAVYPGIAIHNLSADGRRIFFETAEALAAGDTDGINDIYEWQEGSLGEESVDLISTGKSIEYPSGGERASGAYWLPNTIFSITPEGSDVLFGSLEELVPGSGTGGMQAIFDARSNGGFAMPVEPQPCGDTEGCQGSSGSFQPPFSSPQIDPHGANVKPRRRCRHVKRRHGKRAKHSTCRRHKSRKRASR